MEIYEKPKANIIICKKFNNGIKLWIFGFRAKYSSLKTIYWAVVEMYGEETSLFSSSLSGHQVILAACLYERWIIVAVSVMYENCV